MNIAWNRSQGAHRDISLSLPECDVYEVADSYYLRLETGFLASEDSVLKVQLSLGILLGEWIHRIGALNKVGEYCFLPFDFSDEYIGGFRIQMMAEDEVACSYGDTREYGGHSINATRLYDVAFNDALFSMSSRSCLFSRREIMLRIERNIVDILGPLPSRMGCA